MNIESFHSVYTVVLMGLFIGIWIWAWSHKRNDDFKEASRLPLIDDDAGIEQKNEGAGK